MAQSQIDDLQDEVKRLQAQLNEREKQPTNESSLLNKVGLPFTEEQFHILPYEEKKRLLKEARHGAGRMFHSDLQEKDQLLKDLYTNKLAEINAAIDELKKKYGIR